jgi:hypothetical protein
MARDPSDKKPTAEELTRKLERLEALARKEPTAEEREREYLAERERLEALALEFLGGKISQAPDGTIFLKYHELGSEEERAAREALIKLLRGREPLSNVLRWRLAGLLDPAAKFEERKFTIENREGGKQPHHVIAIAIAQFIAIAIAPQGGSQKLESVKEAAKDRFGVSLSTVERAWRDHKNSPLIRGIWEGGRTIN